jgi:hypothetical protein
MKKPSVTDKKRRLREIDHLTVPPRLEGGTKNAMMYSPRKKKKPRTDDVAGCRSTRDNLPC